MLGNVQYRDVLPVWKVVGQGHSVLAVGAGGGCLDFFFLLPIISFSFLPLSGRQLDIDIQVSKRAVKSKTSKQPFNKKELVLVGAYSLLL